MWILLLVALIPMITGSIYYHPAVAGSIWMKENGFTLESFEDNNMPKMLGLAYVASLFLAFALLPVVIHQIGVMSILMEHPGFEEVGGASRVVYADFMQAYGETSRNFGHGSFHGIVTGLLLAGGAIGLNAIFEQRSFKYWAVHTIYFVITLGLMGGAIAQFVPFPTAEFGL